MAATAAAERLIFAINVDLVFCLASLNASLMKTPRPSSAFFLVATLVHTASIRLSGNLSAVCRAVYRLIRLNIATILDTLHSCVARQAPTALGVMTPRHASIIQGAGVLTALLSALQRFIFFLFLWRVTVAAGLRTVIRHLG